MSAFQANAFGWLNWRMPFLWASPMIRHRPQSVSSPNGLTLDEGRHTAERFGMERIIKARGWLRTGSVGSSTASFEIRFGANGARGIVRSELTVIVEAMEAGRAMLVTETGRWIRIRPLESTPEGLTFSVTDDPARVLHYFAR